jgi:putative ATPase
MAKMLTAGEDPRVLFRRMIILACEDVGLADPQAIVVVNAAADSFERVGMPEGNYLLAHACLYLATAPKSNTAGALFAALDYVDKHGTEPVPAHLRDSTASAMLARHEGEESATAAYKYPHSFSGAWVAQQYLPDGMKRPHWYTPKEIGYEREVAERFKGYDFPEPVSQPKASRSAKTDPKPEVKAERPPINEPPGQPSVDDDSLRYEPLEDERPAEPKGGAKKPTKKA